MAPKNQSHRIDELLAGVTADLLAGNPQQFEDTSLRVERILLEMVRPDPVQPRRVLPEQLHFAFHNNRRKGQRVCGCKRGSCSLHEYAVGNSSELVIRLIS